MSLKMPVKRPEVGEIVHSFALELGEYNPGLDYLLGLSPDTQFSRTGAYSAPILNDGVSPLGRLEPHLSVLRYKSSTGWRRADICGIEYARNMKNFAHFVCRSLVGELVNLEYHDSEKPRGIAILIEHTRRFAEGLAAPHEGLRVPLFSGTTQLSANVVPSLFGPHIDFTHTSPSIIGFAASEGSNGTIICDGDYPFLDPCSTKEELNDAGNALIKRDAPTGKVTYGDSRSLLHEGPPVEPGIPRNFIRFYVGPLHPRFL